MMVCEFQLQIPTLGIKKQHCPLVQRGQETEAFFFSVSVSLIYCLTQGKFLYPLHLDFPAFRMEIICFTIFGTRFCILVVVSYGPQPQRS